MNKKIKIRKSWGDLNPATKIVPDKKKYSRKEKHKHFEW
jgi:hypothetical protein